MRVRTIGSLFNYVADMDGEHGRPVTLRRVKLSDALKAERNQLFGKKKKGNGKVAGRFVDYKMNKSIPIKAVYHDEEKDAFLAYGMDFRNGMPKMDKKDLAIKLKQLIEKRCDMSIYEIAMRAYTMEKYYFTAACAIMRYTYDLSTRDTAYLFDIERDIVTNAVKSCRERKFQVGKVLECMKELYEVMR